MDATNYHTFNIQIPVGLHIITPMTTSSSLLDKFSLLLATGLGNIQQSTQRKEIEHALSVEPLSEVQPYELNLALHQMALETAQQITKDFVERLTTKLKLELPAFLSPPAEQGIPPATGEDHVEEPVGQTLEPEPESTPEPPNPKTQDPSSYTIGQKVENDVLASVVAEVGNCVNGYEFAKVEGGYRCNNGQGAHFAPDDRVMQEYEKRAATK